MTRPTSPHADRGSASIWVLACTALLIVLALVAIVRTSAVLARHRAQSAADQAALAAAAQIGIGVDPCDQAAKIAAANAAALSSCQLELAADGRSGTVAVGVALAVTLPIVGGQTVRASARAGRSSKP